MTPSGGSGAKSSLSSKVGSIQAVVLNQGDFASQGHMTVSGGILSYHNCRGVLLASSG